MKTLYEILSIGLSLVVIGLLIYFNTRQHETHQKMIDQLNQINNNTKK